MKKIPTGEEFNLLVADSMHVINAVRKRFQGTIILLGPMPRHMEECCDDQSHKIKDHIGIEVDMVKYVNAFSCHLKNSLNLPHDCYYVDYRQIFGDSFSHESLDDGVHLESKHNDKLAHALLKGYDVLLPAPKDGGDKDCSFSEAMLAADIITPDVKSDSSNGEKALNWDDLDFD